MLTQVNASSLAAGLGLDDEGHVFAGLHFLSLEL